MLSPVKIIINMVPVVLCFLFGGYLVVIGKFTAGGLAAFSLMLGYLVEAAGNIPGYIGDYRKSLGIVSHLFEVLNEKTERDDGEKYAVCTTEPAIEFLDVSFNYDEQAKVLEHLTMKLMHGEKAALVGSSGSGKSTIFKLLCGFYELQKGCIKIYGKNINEWNLSAARTLISMVTQDTYLFPETIAENIAYGHHGASMDEVVSAAKAANAHDFIMEMPEGYNTLVGERGARLSGGQKQRISIARAILKDAPILLLDEATSALDTESEMLVQKALEAIMKGRTVLVIAHRLSTIKDVDEVFVLNQGRIVERGLHEQLIEKDGIYKQLYFKQFSLHGSSQLSAGEGSRYLNVEA